MTMTKPLVVAPIVLTEAAAHVRISYASGSTSDITLAANSYYNCMTDVLSESDTDLLWKLVEALNAWLDDVQITGDWTITTPGTGLGYRVALEYDPSGTARTYGGTTIQRLTFLTTELTSVDLGFNKVVGSPDQTALFSSGGGVYTLTGSYQRSHVWNPDDYLLEWPAFPLAELALDVSPFNGDAYIDDYGEYSLRQLLLEFVAGARIYQFAADDSVLIAGVSGASVGDPNLALESLWRIARQETVAGVPPTLRVYPDRDSPGTYWECVWADSEQLRDLRGVAELQSRAPLRYRVRLQLLEV